EDDAVPVDAPDRQVVLRRRNDGAAVVGAGTEQDGVPGPGAGDRLEEARRVLRHPDGRAGAGRARSGKSARDKTQSEEGQPPQGRRGSLQGRSWKHSSTRCSSAFSSHALKKSACPVSWPPEARATPAPVLIG